MSATITAAQPVRYEVSYCLTCGRLATCLDSQGHTKCETHSKPRKRFWERFTS